MTEVIISIFGSDIKSLGWEGQGCSQGSGKVANLNSLDCWRFRGFDFWSARHKKTHARTVQWNSHYFHSFFLFLAINFTLRSSSNRSRSANLPSLFIKIPLTSETSFYQKFAKNSFLFSISAPLSGFFESRAQWQAPGDDERKQRAVEIMISH